MPSHDSRAVGTPGVPGRRVLVLGASGILAPVVGVCTSRGHTVVAVGRSQERLSSLRSRGTGALQLVSADAGSGAGLGQVVAAGPFDAAVLYGPAVPARHRAVLLEQVHGRAVIVVTSEAADPSRASGPPAALAASRDREGDAVVLLGWSAEPRGPRWHTPREVSAAAIEALDTGDDVVVGQVRPWEQRPA